MHGQTAHERMQPIRDAIDAIHDSMAPGELIGRGDFRNAVIALSPGSTNDYITAGILEGINGPKFATEGTLHIKRRDDSDSRLTGNPEDDARWLASVSHARPIRKSN